MGINSIPSETDCTIFYKDVLKITSFIPIGRDFLIFLDPISKCNTFDQFSKL